MGLNEAGQEFHLKPDAVRDLAKHYLGAAAALVAIQVQQKAAGAESEMGGSAAAAVVKTAADAANRALIRAGDGFMGLTTTTTTALSEVTGVDESLGEALKAAAENVR